MKFELILEVKSDQNWSMKTLISTFFKSKSVSTRMTPQIIISSYSSSKYPWIIPRGSALLTVISSVRWITEFLLACLISNSFDSAAGNLASVFTLILAISLIDAQGSVRDGIASIQRCKISIILPNIDISVSISE